MIDFNKKVKDIVEKIFEGIPSNINKNSSWFVKTKAGDLRISIHPDASCMFSIFTCFDDEKRAKNILESIGCAHNLNYHSGKWNHHSTDFYECLNSFFEPLTKIYIHEPITPFQPLSK